MTQPPTIPQLHNLADRAGRGPLTPDEITRLRDGINQLDALQLKAARMEHATRQAAELAVRLEDAEAELARLRPAADPELQQRLEAAITALGKSETDLAALRAVARGYCPHCGRGDAAPTVDDWEQQRRHAEDAEQRLRHLQVTSEAAGILLDRTTDERDQYAQLAEDRAQRIGRLTAEREHLRKRLAEQENETMHQHERAEAALVRPGLVEDDNSVTDIDPAWTPPLFGDTREQLPAVSQFPDELRERAEADDLDMHPPADQTEEPGP